MNSADIHRERLGKVIERLQRTDLDALLLNRLSNIAWLTGAVNSCSWVFVNHDGRQVALVLDSDAEVYREESVITDVRTFRMHDPFTLFRKIATELGFPRRKLGLELGRPGLPHHVLAVLRQAFPAEIELVNGEDILEEIRIIKSEEEIEAIKEAARISQLGLESAISNIRPGVRESEIALEAEYAMRKAGGRLGALTYVASGRRSSLAHHTPSGKKIEPGDVITIDVHGAHLGYCADLARSVVYGPISPEVQEAYACLLRAEEEAIRACRHGRKLTEIRKLFYAGLNQAQGCKFLTGPVLHGVGIMNYELPSFGFPHQDRGHPETLARDMVVAVSNLGLYSERGWGLRVEDTVLVTQGEPVYLTDVARGLLSV